MYHHVVYFQHFADGKGTGQTLKVEVATLPSSTEQEIISTAEYALAELVPASEDWVWLAVCEPALP